MSIDQDSDAAAQANGDRDRGNRDAWARYLARMIDGLLVWFVMALLSFLLAVSLEAISPDLLEAYFAIHEDRLWQFVAGVPIILLSWLFFDTLALSLFGTTPGKLLMGVKVTGRDGGKPSVFAALWRSLLVQIIGLGARLPLLSIATLLLAYNRAAEGRTMLWDTFADTTATRTPVAEWRWWLAGSAWALTAAGNMAARLLL